MQPKKVACSGAVIRLLGEFIGVLFGYGMGSLYGLATGDTMIRQKLAWLTLFLRNWLTVKQPLLP